MIETIAKDFNQYHIVNEILPVTLLSGPIIEELKINNKNGYLAPGHRANATIGRALLMCMINIGWRRMDVYSSPAAPASLPPMPIFLSPKTSLKARGDLCRIHRVCTRRQHGYDLRDTVAEKRTGGNFQCRGV
jgi:hypothetical protein